MKKSLHQTWWTILALSGFVMWSVGFLSEKIWGINACRMCLIQRSLFLSIGIFASLTGLMRENITGRIFGWITTVAVITLFAVSTYHVGLQYEWIRPSRFCAVHHQASSLDLLLGTPTASCHERTLDILGIPASLYAMVLSGLSMLACLFALGKTSKK